MKSSLSIGRLLSRRGTVAAVLVAALLLCAPSCSLIRKARDRNALAMKGEHVVSYAKTFLGSPYAYGGSGPRTFDCSGFTCYVYRHFGYELHRSATDQGAYDGQRVSRRDLRPGDLVFFGKKGSVREIGHVGIVVSIDEEHGSFTFIHASVSKGVTEETSSSPYFLMRYMGARRILPDE